MEGNREALRESISGGWRRDLDFPGHMGTRGMNTKKNICKKIAETVAEELKVSSTVFMLSSDYFYIRNKHEKQNMGIVWVVNFNTLVCKYFVTA